MRLVAVVVALLAFAAPDFAQAAWPPLRAGEPFERAWGEDVVQGNPTTFEVCTVASTCKAGTGTSAIGGTLAPRDAAVGPDGNVYVADGIYHRVQVFTADGTFLRAWGKGVNSAQPNAFGVCTVAADCRVGIEGPEGGALNEPAGIAVDSAGHVIVGETRAARVSEFDASGTFIRLWGRRVNSAQAGDGFEICSAAEAAQCTLGLAGGGNSGMGGQFLSPQGIAADASGNVYVADDGYHRVQKFNSARQFVYAVGASVNNNPNSPLRHFCNVAADCKEGGASGIGGGFDRPRDIAVAPDGDFVVGEAAGYRMSRFSASGTWERSWGRGVSGGSTAQVCTVSASCVHAFPGQLGGELSGVSGVAVDATGRISASEGDRIQVFDADGGFMRAWGRGVDAATPDAFGVCTVAADCRFGQAGALGGELSQGAGVGAAADSTLFVADAGNSRLVRFGTASAPPPPPAAPTVSAVSPGSPANDNSPKVTGTAPAGTTVKLYGNSACTGTVLATGTAVAFASPGLTITVADNSTTTVYATATNANGTSACSTTSVTYVEQTPATTVRFFTAATVTGEAVGTVGLTVERMGDTTGSTTVSFATADGTAVSPADFVAGAGTITFAPGETQRQVQVTYVDDNVDEGDEVMSVILSQPTGGASLIAPSTIAVTITDDDRIDTAITAGPEGPTNDATPTFAFTADPAAGATFECAVDAGAFAACTTPHTTALLPDGPHTFRVRALRPNGSRDLSPATRSFFVDTVAPVTLLSVGAKQGAGTQSGPGRFVGTVEILRSLSDPAPSPGGGGIQCVLDPSSAPQTIGEISGSCPLIFDVPGSHTVYAASFDAAGNQEAPVKSVSFEIAGPPDTTITGGPESPTFNLRPSFTFTSTVPGSTFRCRVDNLDLGVCSSPFRLPNELGPGPHFFEVQAVSPEGAADPTRARRDFTVAGPEVTSELCSDDGAAAIARGNAQSEGPACTITSGPCPARARCVKRTTVCPVGATCENVLTVRVSERDGNVEWSCITLTSYVPGGTGNFVNGQVFDTTKADGTCSHSTTSTIVGAGRPLQHTCSVKYSGPEFPLQETSYGVNADRRLTCDLALTIRPSAALDASARGTGVTAYAPGAGTMTIAPGSPAGRRAMAARSAFKTTAKRVSAAGPVTFKLKLRGAAGRKLRRKRKLPIAVRLSFRPAAGGAAQERTVRLTLRR